MLKLPRLKNCLVYGRAEHKRLVENMSAALEPNSCARQIIRVFLCGDVMTGRGIDQIMPHPCDPQLYEDWVQSASDYVRLAERVNGKIPTHVAPTYVWGVASGQLKRVRPDASRSSFGTVALSGAWA
jgi:hypothetical protein